MWQVTEFMRLGPLRATRVIARLAARICTLCALDDDQAHLGGVALAVRAAASALVVLGSAQGN
jgi:hypothetical protein